MRQKMNEADTTRLYESIVAALEIVEESGGVDFQALGDDRMLAALSTAFTALYAQCLHRYRPEALNTVLVVANMVRNLASIDQKDELLLATGVLEFMYSMSQIEQE